ncbi:MAG: hypothetical protein EOO99_03960 [Pedobacter sp.]|nr:MAG: hypothetical protein EOO99_03960 [Pedobacter sp.]
MVNRASYQAAKLVSVQVERHFAHHLQLASDAGEIELAPLPPARVIEAIIDVAFWASLRKEEGYSPKISLAFLPPEMTQNPILFKKPLDLNPNVLTKIAPGMSRSGTYLGIWHDGYQLYIWGSTQVLPNYCFVTDVSEPGLLVVKHRRMHGFGKFANVLVLKGEQIKYLVEKKVDETECPSMLTTLLDVDQPAGWDDAANILIQLAVSMRAHGRGGSLVIVSNGDELWKESIIQPMSYPLLPSYKGLSKLLAKEIGPARSEVYWQSAVKKQIDYIAGVTAIDGATIINSSFELLGFGAKLTRSVGSSTVTEVSYLEPVEGNQVELIHPAKLGGTRHFSAAQFVYDQHLASVLVASQDGHFTVFSWSDYLNRVQAYRIDSLLL